VSESFPESQRRARGHVFTPPAIIRRRTPAVGATDGTGPLAHRLVLAHYFTGSWDWYVVEADWSTGEAWGYVKGPAGAEWGRFDLTELEQVRPHGTYTRTGLPEGLVGTGHLIWLVERDCWWTPQTVAAARILAEPEPPERQSCAHTRTRQVSEHDVECLDCGQVSA
jgi:hypothetical protein